MEEVVSTLQQMEVASTLEEGAHASSIWRWPTEPTHPNRSRAESAVDPLAQLQATLKMEVDVTAEELAVEAQVLAAEAQAFAAEALAAEAQAAEAEVPTEPTQPNMFQAESAVEAKRVLVKSQLQANPKQAQDLEANIQAKSQPASKPSEEGKNPSNLSEQERAWQDEALTVGPELWERFSEQELLDRRAAAPGTPKCAMDLVRSPRQTPPPSPPEWSGSPVSTKTSEAGQTS